MSISILLAIWIIREGYGGILVLLYRKLCWEIGVLGEFKCNQELLKEERGGSQVNRREIDELNQFIDILDLINMPVVRCRFTWFMNDGS